MIEPRETMLDFIDREPFADFMHHMRDRGMVFRMGATVERIERDASGTWVIGLADGREVRAGAVLFAAEHMGATANLQP